MKKLRHIMSTNVGVIRSGDGLREAVIAIDELERSPHSVRFGNTLTTAKLVAIAALKREESRGSHFRTDFPGERDEWKRRTFITLDEAEGMISEVTGKPAPIAKTHDLDKER